MIPARSLARAAARSARAPRAHQIRLQSTTTSSSTGAAQSSGTSPFVAGAVGGLAAGVTLYGIYLMTPSGKVARSINKTAKEAQKKYQVAAQKLQESTPDADEAASYIKDLCYSYVSWVPGGRQYVDAAFRDLDKVRSNHGDEADAIIKDAHKQLKEVASSGGLNLDTARRALDILADVASKAAELGGDVIADVLEEHPQAREKLGGGVEELRRLGDQLGPEAKKQVEETWRQLAEVARGGFSADNLNRARELLREKTEQVQRLGDEAWKKGMEQAKPLLDKNPRVKKLLEENADALRQGNAGELFNRARKAVESGDTGDLENYVREAVDKVKKSKVGSGLGLEQYLDELPSGSEILPKLQQLREVAAKHTDESEELVRETVKELKQVLESKSEKAKGILEKAKQESK